MPLPATPNYYLVCMILLELGFGLSLVVSCPISATY